MEVRLNHLTYAICNIATDLSNIDFSQVGQSSAGTILTFHKWGKVLLEQLEEV